MCLATITIQEIIQFNEESKVGDLVAKVPQIIIIVFVRETSPIETSTYCKEGKGIYRAWN